MLLRLGTALIERYHTLLAQANRDRGEGPIPYVVMVAVVGAGAIVIGGLVVLYATDWIAKIKP